MVDCDVMRKVFQAAELFEMLSRHPVWIISGWRSREEQRQLEKAGRQTASDELSTHRSCPSTGVDISLGPVASRDHIQSWGIIAQLVGLRWGGGSSLDEDGIPTDWRHVDAGRRQV